MKDPGNFPLAGVRVLEFGQIAAGPFTGSLLADLGADVVKVERPDGGDGMRAWPPLTGVDTAEGGYSENFASLNRNKRSITVDLKDSASVERLKKLADNCDVILENFRPGVLQRLGLGYEEMKKTNRQLVYCSISGYGQTGPYAKKGAFDVTVQGMSGLMSVTGEAGGAPVKSGVPVGDFCAGLYGAYTILAKLMQARQSGEGGYIDCSMLGCLLGVAALQTSEYFGTGNTPRKMGSAHPRNAPYQAFRASDDYFIIAAGNDRALGGSCRRGGHAGAGHGRSVRKPNAAGKEPDCAGGNPGTALCQAQCGAMAGGNGSPRCAVRSDQYLQRYPGRRAGCTYATGSGT